ncbi:unnamed protein product [Caretta caretta]
MSQKLRDERKEKLVIKSHRMRQRIAKSYLRAFFAPAEQELNRTQRKPVGWELKSRREREETAVGQCPGSRVEAVAGKAPPVSDR